MAHPLSPTRQPGKWEDRNLHLQNLAVAVNGSVDPVLVVADLNTTMWSPFYRDLVTTTGLSNARRGHGMVATYPAPVTAVTGLPIDHILYRGGFYCEACGHGSHVGSDHLAFWADLGLDDVSRSRP